MPATPAWQPKSAPRLFVPPRLAAGEAWRVEGNQAPIGLDRVGEP